MEIKLSVYINAIPDSGSVLFCFSYCNYDIFIWVRSQIIKSSAGLSLLSCIRLFATVCSLVTVLSLGNARISKEHISAHLNKTMCLKCPSLCKKNYNKSPKECRRVWGAPSLLHRAFRMCVSQHSFWLSINSSITAQSWQSGMILYFNKWVKARQHWCINEQKWK